MKCVYIYLRLFTTVILIFTCLPNGTNSRSRDRGKKSDHRKLSCDFRWSAWSDFSPCSRSCGLGIKSRHRTCYEYGPDPRPVNGKNCKGKTRDHQACNAQPCPPGSRDFRELQCSFLKGQTFQGQTYQWKVFSQVSRANAVSDPCVLTCTEEKFNGPVVKFVDGTQCGSNAHMVCVAGICVPIGCDSRPYSNKSFDRCGVCGGSNNTCHTVTRRISHRVPTGYTELLRIPEGSRYVKVTERTRSDVVLTLKNAQGTSIIKGQRPGSHNTDTKLMAGTVVYYYHPRQGLENIRAEGPLNETVIVMGYSRVPSVVSLWYEYIIANSKPPIQSQIQTQVPPITDPSYPWQSLLYHQVLKGRGLSGPDPPIQSKPDLSYMLSTVQPSCQKHMHSRHHRDNHDGSRHRKRTRKRQHFQRFQILKVATPIKGSGRRKSSNSKSKYDETRPIVSNHKRVFSPKKNSNIIYSRSRTFGNVSVVGSKTKPVHSSGINSKTNLGPIVTPRAKVTKRIQKHTRPTGKPRTNIGRADRNTNNRHGGKPMSSLNSERGSGRSFEGSQSRADDRTEGHNAKLAETRFILNVRTTISPSTRPQVPARFNTSQSRRKPIEEPIPTFMPNENDKGSNEDLSMHRGGIDPDEEEDEGGERPDLQVDLSIQVAARKSKKAEKRRRGRDRGRRRKKDERVNKRRFRWQANPVSPCTSTCQVGTTVTLFSCYQHSGERVNDKFCDADSKPPPSHHACATKTCRPRWEAGLWSECSESCGEGRQHRTARCWQMMAPGFDSTVRDFTCNPDEKPQTERTCHKLRSCVPQWEMSSWEGCSTECGYGVQLRHVRCSAESEAVCSARKRPPDKRPCRNKPCVNQWYTLPWSSCSGMCGIRKRKVYCRDAQGRVLDDRKCDYNSKPLTVHACGRCKNKWVPQEWGECSVTCGGGVTTRRVVCGTTRGGNFHIRPDSFCVKEVRPPTTTTCRTAPCGATWYTTEWTECSESCGPSGQRYRDVRCYGGTATELCDIKRRPEERITCELPPCETRQVCEDDGETRCDLVVSAKLCSHKYYRKACCNTCSSYT